MRSWSLRSVSSAGACSHAGRSVGTCARGSTSRSAGPPPRDTRRTSRAFRTRTPALCISGKAHRYRFSLESYWSLQTSLARDQSVGRSPTQISRKRMTLHSEENAVRRWASRVFERFSVSCLIRFFQAPNFIQNTHVHMIASLH